MSGIDRYDEEAAKRNKVIPGVIKPPLHNLTRVQKRYLLEPWFTTGWIVSWFLSLVGFTLACLLPYHVEAASLAGIWLLVGTGFAWAKYWHQDANARTEGEIRSSRSNW